MDNLETALFYLTHGIDYERLSWFYLVAGLCLIIGYIAINFVVENNKPEDKKLSREENWPRPVYYLAVGILWLWIADLALWVMIAIMNIASQYHLGSGPSTAWISVNGSGCVSSALIIVAVISTAIFFVFSG